MSVTPEPATATWSRPPSIACSSTETVVPPKVMESDCTAAGSCELSGTILNSTSRPRFLKRPWSMAMKPGAKSAVAV